MFKQIFDWIKQFQRRHTEVARLPYGRVLKHEALEPRQMLATYVVNSLGDGHVAPANGFLSLREAIAYINGDAEPLELDLKQIVPNPDPLDPLSRIVFDPELEGGTLLLSEDTDSPTPALEIRSAMSIEGRVPWPGRSSDMAMSLVSSHAHAGGPA